jgi:hypothetical protein
LIRVAFTLISGANWLGTGGYNYLVNLAQVLSAHAQDRVQMVLFVGHDTVAANVEPFAAISGVEVVRVSVQRRAKESASAPSAIDRL